MDMKLPQWVKGMVKTKNQMGVMTLELSPPALQCADFCTTVDKPVLDVGCAYGASSIAFLKAGAKVIACDLSQEHLDHLEQIVPENLSPNLTTLQGAFPEELDFPAGSLSAVHMTMILHFLRGDVIVSGLKKCFDWLEPGGKIFIGNMTPYLGLYEWERLSSEYERREQAGEQWPGEIAQREYAKGDWKQALPPMAHFFKEDSMRKIAELSGFEVESISYYQYKNTPPEYRTNGKEWIGMVAFKK